MKLKRIEDFVKESNEEDFTKNIKSTKFKIDKLKSILCKIYEEGGINTNFNDDEGYSLKHNFKTYWDKNGDEILMKLKDIL